MGVMTDLTRDLAGKEPTEDMAEAAALLAERHAEPSWAERVRGAVAESDP
jgi:hypothetical protein